MTARRGVKNWKYFQVQRADLLDTFDYDPSTGNLVWRDNGVNRRPGKAAGNLNLGYREVEWRGVRYYCHKLVWLIIYGTVPYEIDHIDCDKLNNRIENLREATRVDNGANRRMTVRNTSGSKGVTWNKRAGKWQASCGRVGGYIGMFDTKEAAALAYAEAAARRYGEFARA